MYIEMIDETGQSREVKEQTLELLDFAAKTWQRKTKEMTITL